jgi:hypothetical protein
MKDLPLSNITKHKKYYNILFDPASSVTAYDFFCSCPAYTKCLQGAPSFFMTSVFMLTAGDSGIIQITCEPTFGDIFYITGTSSQNLDALAVQNVHCPLSHVARKHVFHAHFCQCLGNIRFAAAAGGWCNSFFCEYFVFVINGEHRKTFAVSKVFIYLILI